VKITQKALFASILIRYFRLSTLIRRLYPFASDIAFENVRPESVLQLGQYFGVRAAVGSHLIRLGSSNDGGYLLVDDCKITDVVLSLGIGDNNSFDVEIAKRVKAVHMFDHTISELPKKIQNGYFHRIGISDSATETFTTIPQAVLEYSSTQEFILKIDIEGDEWKVLDSLDVNFLARFKQITGEFHGFHKLISQPNELSRAIRVLSKLASHHKFVNLHANNWAKVEIVKGMLIPDVIEFTLAREDVISELKSSENVDISLNEPNNPEKSEIYLGLFSYL
jgi:hypothetical protein